MGEDDIVELLWKGGQIVRSSQTRRPSTHPPILRGSGSGGSGSGGSGGGGEGNALFPQPPPLHIHQPPPDQHLFMDEDEMASWLHHPLREDEFRSHLFYSGQFISTPSPQPQSSLSLALPPPPPPRAPYDLPAERPTGQFRRTENFMSFSRLRGSIYAGGGVEAAGPWISMVRGSTQVGSSAIPSSSATGSSLTLATEGTESRPTVIGLVPHTFAVPSLSRKAAETVCEIASSSVSKTETEPIATETGTADDRKRKEREETTDQIQETEEAHGSTSRKRSRAAEMHNISERRRRERINEKMKALQELVPRCNKSDKASMLDDAIEYLKSLQMQLQIMSTGGGDMMPMMYTPDMQRFMTTHMAMGMMGMNRPPFIPFPGTAFPSPTHMAGPGPSYPAPPYPFPNIQAYDPSRVQFPSQQRHPTSNQPQLPGYLNPYSQFVGLQQMQQPPPPLQNQSTAQLSFSQASSSKEPEDQGNQPTG